MGNAVVYLDHQASPPCEPGVLEAMAAKGKELSKARKKRELPASLASPEDLKS